MDAVVVFITTKTSLLLQQHNAPHTVCDISLHIKSIYYVISCSEV